MSKDKHLACLLSDFYKKYKKDHHPIVGFYMFNVPMIVIVSVELARSILTTHFHYFEDRGMYNNQRDDPPSMILGSLEYEKWRDHRSILKRGFTPKKIRDMFPIMKKIGQELVNGLIENIKASGKQQVEIRSLFSKFTTDIIGEKSIGINCDSSQLREMTQQAMAPYLKFPWNLFTIAYPNVARWIGIRKYPKLISDFILNLTKQNIQQRKERASEKRSDFMQLLIDAGFGDDEIAAYAFDFLSAGYADSTSTLSYCIHELALPENQHIQEKARAEIQMVLNRHNGQLSYDTVQEMKYIGLIIEGNLLVQTKIIQFIYCYC